MEKVTLVRVLFSKPISKKQIVLSAQNKHFFPTQVTTYKIKLCLLFFLVVSCQTLTKNLWKKRVQLTHSVLAYAYNGHLIKKNDETFSSETRCLAI